MKTRIHYIDNMRGFLILLVVLGHTILGLSYLFDVSTPFGYALYLIFFITYSFHMPAFFMLSGYLRSDVLPKDKNALWQSIKRKLIALGLPYLLCSIAYWLIKLLLSSFLVKPLDVQSLLLIPIQPIEFFWYLYALLLMNIIADIIEYFFRYKHNRIILFILFLIIGLFYTTDYQIYVFIHLWQYFVFFYLGSIVKKYEKQFHSFMIPLVCLFGYIAVFYINAYTGVYPFYLCLGFLATIFFTSCFLLLPNKPIPILNQLGKSSMPIYIMHTIFVGATRTILYRIGITNIALHVILGFLLPVIISYTFYEWVIKRVPVMNFFFYPGKYLNRHLKK